MNNQKTLSYFKQQPNKKDFFLKKDKKKEVNIALKLVLTPEAIAVRSK